MKPAIEKKGNYSNINLALMEDNETLEVEKVFMEGRAVESKFQPMKADGKKEDGTPNLVRDTTKPTQYNYSCRVKLDGEEVSFWLKEKDHADFKACGEVGSKILITCHEEKYMDKKNKKQVRTSFTFTEL